MCAMYILTCKLRSYLTTNNMHKHHLGWPNGYVYILESGSFAGTWLGLVVYVHSNIIPHAILFLHRPVTVFYVEKLCGQKLKRWIFFPITWFFCTDVLCACTWICVCVSMCMCVCMHEGGGACTMHECVCGRRGIQEHTLVYRDGWEGGMWGGNEGGQIQNQNFLRSKNVYLGITQQYHKPIWHRLKSLTHTQ